MSNPVVLILGGLVHYQVSKEVRVPAIVTWIHEHGAADLTLFLRGGLLQYRDRATQGEAGEVDTWHVPQVPHLVAVETKLPIGEPAIPLVTITEEEKETLTKKKK